MGRRTKIYLSYRPGDADFAARSLFQSLRERFGAEAVLRGACAGEPGDARRERLDFMLANVGVMLVAVGGKWLETRDAGGRRLIDDPDDPVRLEISAALERKLFIAPVLIDDAPQPVAAELPEELAAFVDRPAARLSLDNFSDDVAAIQSGLRSLLRPSPRKLSSRGVLPPVRRMIDAMALGLALGGVGYAVLQQMTPPQTTAIRAPGHEAASLLAYAEGIERRKLAALEGASREVAQRNVPRAELRDVLKTEMRRLQGATEEPNGRRIETAGVDLKKRQPPKRVAEAAAPSPAIPTPSRTAGSFEARLLALPQGEGLKECEACPELVAIPGGEFRMGSPEGEAGRSENEGPQLTRVIAPFAIGRYEVSFDEWDACAADGFCRPVPKGGPRDNDTDRGWGRAERPVIEISWNDISGAEGGEQGFVAWLNSKVSGSPYRLPSEAEWEYAARAGGEAAFWWGGSVTPAQANYNGTQTYGAAGKTGEYRRRTLPVGAFEPNPFGLHQTHGNVWEWVRDCWRNDYAKARKDGSAWMTERGGDCSSAVLRGGGWSDDPASLRSANRVRGRRDAREVAVGFRIARSLSGGGS